MRRFFTLLYFEFLTFRRRPQEVLLGVFFLFLGAFLFSFIGGPTPNLLTSSFSLSFLWILMFLTQNLMAQSFFERDWREGILEGLFFSSLPLEGIVLAKILAQWLKSLLSLALVLPFLFLILGIEWSFFGKTLGCLCLSSLSLTAWSALGAALCLSHSSGFLLIFLILMPLQIPLLIFSLSLFQFNTSSTYLYLGALAFLTVPLASLASAPLLRETLEE